MLFNPIAFSVQAFLSIADEVVKQRYSDVRAMMLSSFGGLAAGVYVIHVIPGAAQHVPSQETKPKKEAELPARALDAGHDRLLDRVCLRRLLQVLTAWPGSHASEAGRRCRSILLCSAMLWSGVVRSTGSPEVS